MEDVKLPKEIYFDERAGTNGIHCLDYKNESDIKYIRSDVVKQQNKELIELENENEELIKANKILYTCWINLHTIRYDEAKPEDRWYDKIEKMAKSNKK